MANHGIVFGDLCYDIKEDLIYAGRAEYKRATNDCRHAQIAIVDHKYFAFLFPLRTDVLPILKKGEDNWDSSDKYILRGHLYDPPENGLMNPFLDVIESAFYPEDGSFDEDNWNVAATYMMTPNGASRPSRFYIFYPPHTEKNPQQYVQPMLTQVRELGPVFNIEFGKGPED